MLTIKQTSVVVKEGKTDCNHFFIYEKSNWSLKERFFSQQRVCTKCGRMEQNTSQLVKKEISFADVVSHFHGE